MFCYRRGRELGLYIFFLFLNNEKEVNCFEYVDIDLWFKFKYSLIFCKICINKDFFVSLVLFFIFIEIKKRSSICYVDNVDFVMCLKEERVIWSNLFSLVDNVLILVINIDGIECIKYKGIFLK